MHVAKGNIADETLELLDDDGEEWITPFRDVSADGPWNDIVHYEFRCTSCGRKFRLSVETYHGQGGAWSPCNF